MSVPETATKTLASLHDVELAALAAAGERRAFGELARRHGAAVRVLLRRLGADAKTADLLARDAFVEAFERIGEFRGQGTFAAWIRRSAGRLYARRLRRTGGRAPAPAASPPTPGGLDAALEHLPAPERLCVGLSLGAGLTAAEIAKLIDANPETVKSHVRDGLDKLRVGLKGSPRPGGSGFFG